MKENINFQKDFPHLSSAKLTKIPLISPKKEAFSMNNDSDPQSPYYYLQARKKNFNPTVKRIAVNTDNFSYYKQLAETNLKENQPNLAVSLYRDCILSDIFIVFS